MPHTVHSKRDSMYHVHVCALYPLFLPYFGSAMYPLFGFLLCFVIKVYLYGFVSVLREVPVSML